MFNCYLHGWSSPTYECPRCFTQHTSTSSSASIDTSFIAVSGSEYRKLKDDLRRLEAQLKVAVEALTHVSRPVEKGDCCHMAFMKCDSTLNNHLVDVSCEALDRIREIVEGK